MNERILALIFHILSICLFISLFSPLLNCELHARTKKNPKKIKNLKKNETQKKKNWSFHIDTLLLTQHSQLKRLEEKDDRVYCTPDLCYFFLFYFIFIIDYYRYYIFNLHLMPFLKLNIRNFY